MLQVLLRCRMFEWQHEIEVNAPLSPPPWAGESRHGGRSPLSDLLHNVLRDTPQKENSCKKYVDNINAINKASSQGRPNFDADRATLEPYRNKALGRQKELIHRDPRYHAAEKALAAKRKEIADMSEKTRKLKMELMPLEKGLNDAKAAALEVYSPEAKWLASFEYKSFGKHYNFNYNRYFGRKIKEGGTGIPIHSNVGRLQEIAELGNNPAVWRTEVNWDWRTPEEVSGSIDDLPLMQKWIERNRGPVHKSNPAKRK